MGFPKDKNPAEKTIYHTLLLNTGIHQTDAKNLFATFNEPSDKSFLPLWERSIEFLESAKLGKRSVAELVEALQAQPFNLKNGFLEFWIPTFLFIYREEYSLFKEAYIPNFSAETIELLFKYAKKFYIKTYNIEGLQLQVFNEYRSMVQKEVNNDVNSTSFKEIATPFLRFYKQLPAYSKNTKRLSKSTLAFRLVLSKAKELEKTFFEDMPAAFNYTFNAEKDTKQQMQVYFDKIQGAIRELRQSFSQLVNRIEGALLSSLGYTENMAFEQYVEKIRSRYEALKTHMLMPHQKMFYSRLMSQIEDKENWLKNVVHALLGKKLENISDLEEATMLEKMNTIFQELDDLIELSKTKLDDSEEVIRIKIAAQKKEGLTKNIIISEKQQKEVYDLEQELSKYLSKDSKINQAALARLLKKYME